MAQRWMKATDTFVAMLKDGSQKFVQKGDTLPDSHELVKRDQDPAQGAGLLFKPLDQEEEAVPAKSEPAKAEPKAPVKAVPAKAETARAEEAPKVTRPAGKAS